MATSTTNLLRLKDFSPDYITVADISGQDVLLFQPVRLDYDLWLVVKRGSVRIASDIVITDIPTSSFSVLSSGKIIEVMNITDDFEGTVFILSEKFQNDLGLSELMSLKLRFNLSPTVLLEGQSMEALEDFHRMAARIISLHDNPHRWESLRNLTKAFYYGGGYYFFQGENRPYSDDSTLTRFLTLAEKYASSERETFFYADRLCLTSKYLSRLVKEKTGRTAKEIILNYVSLQARTMLLGTDLSIQQISDALHFPSQSVFGKFFKKANGLSPREYRNHHVI
ncbi:MAG: AraC family transcriptional regulator [Bacteroidales bacterium]|nr:AraC family transcriptional regulator [Bacteroidales bacterium]